MIHTLSPPDRSETNATRLPSGLKRGWTSYAIPLVSRVARPPAIGIVYRSPRRSNTTVRPSGDTSSEIHDPFVVVKLAVRAADSGRSFFLAVSRPAPARPCAGSGLGV